MSELSAYTDCLDLLAAKKLLNLFQKPREIGSWADWSGDGGVGLSAAFQKIDGNQIGSIILPDHCTSFSINSWDYICFEGNEMPETLFLGGDNWWPPDFGDCGEVRFYFMPKGFNHAVNLCFSKRTGMRWFNRQYDKCIEISISLGNLLYLITLDEVNSNCGSEENLMSLWKDMSLPDELAEGFIEAVHFDNSNRFYFDPAVFPDFGAFIKKVVREFTNDSPIKRFYVWSKSGLGGQASFEGQSFNVAQLARDLLVSVAAKKCYPLYDINYSYLGPRSWGDREKSRKKLKSPTSEQLGTATLENGAVAAVSLGIGKEGYVFELNFGSDDDYIKFYHSKLFQKAKWHSGAE